MSESLYLIEFSIEIRRCFIMKRTLTRKHVKVAEVDKGWDRVRKIVINQKVLENCSASTIDGYNRIFTALQEYFGDREDAMNITESEAKNFIRWLNTDKVHYHTRNDEKTKQRGIKASTVNTYLKLCKTIYTILVEQEYISKSPFNKIKYLKRQKETVKTIPLDELKYFLDSLNQTYYTEFRLFVGIHVLLDTFGRIDEVMNIKLDDIDFKKQIILFPKTKNNQPRYVGFTNRTAKLMKELIEETRDFQSEYLFVGSAGKKLSPEAFRANLKRYQEMYDIKTQFSCHAFRHTAAMLFIENGGNIRILQKILGHARIDTTEIYAHVSEEITISSQKEFSPLDNVFNANLNNNIRTRKRRLK
ncbi:tyrosine-type recombinase/integrase [Macrococcus sp. EM39E]|uniref:tyrosine-type recombinase/integrase n=1 Tax=Macrococcus animalis TaxID=3395467 RepID=UPI0039BE3D51